jgi:hypothetical protein
MFPTSDKEVTAMDAQAKISSVINNNPALADKLLTYLESLSKVDTKSVHVSVAAKKESVTQPFVILFHENLLKLFMQDFLSKSDLKVTLNLCAIASFGNLIQVNQKTLAEICSLTQQQVSKSMKNLEMCGVIFKISIGTFLNPAIFTKGKLSAIPDELWVESVKQSDVIYPLKKKLTDSAKELQEAQLEAAEVISRIASTKKMKSKKPITVDDPFAEIEASLNEEK